MADEIEDTQLNLHIPGKVLLEEFNCPICFEFIDDCHMTPCGHNFCLECISECLNRKHSCPCCNAETKQSQLVRNWHMDSLLKTIQQQMKESSKRYYDALIAPHGAKTTKEHQVVVPSQNAASTSKLSPIGDVFNMHLKKSIGAYETYYQELNERWEKRRKRLKKEYHRKLIAEESPEKKKEVEQEFKALSEDLDYYCKQSISLLIKSYDRELKKFVPTPVNIPMYVSLVVPEKNISFRNVLIGPTDTVDNVLKALIAKTKDTPNELASVEDPQWFVRRSSLPLAPASSDKDGGIPQEMSREQWATQKVQYSEGKESPIADVSKPILANRVEPGCWIVLRGKLKFTADEPEKCIRNDWKEGVKVDYLRCAPCKMNWICPPCARACHTGHQLTPFTSTSPSWPCCYCVKTGSCKK